MALPIEGECSTAKMRGVLVAVNIVAVTLGQLVAGFCCGIFLHAPSGWRLMLGLATLPALIQLIGGLYFIPESPRYILFFKFYCKRILIKM